jgi:hypothetical protein
MDGNNENIVECCICEMPLSLAHALEMIVSTAVHNDGSQHLFVHKNCFTKTVSKNIPLHPDFFD